MYWSVPREWPDGECFIVAGGPSVADEDTDTLRGRHVIAINSSFERAPFADYLFFGDRRWWRVNLDRIKRFQGKKVTVAEHQPRQDMEILQLRKVRPPPGLCEKPDGVVMHRTSLTGGINFAVHLGVKRIVLLGADMKKGAGGRTHHHSPHPWPSRPGCWDMQMKDLIQMAEPLKRKGVEVVNTSLGSRIDFWPKVPFSEAL